MCKLSKAGVHKHISFREKGTEKAAKPKTYKCSPCDKTFDSHNSLQMHNAVSHAKSEPLEFEQGKSKSKICHFAVMSFFCYELMVQLTGSLAQSN